MLFASSPTFDGKEPVWTMRIIVDGLLVQAGRCYGAAFLLSGTNLGRRIYGDGWS